jgi:hypothetical protein|uniref:Uncharacterized protein n=1 Tax=viral metagenome TaxID=1070528 RepID=A0A6C0BSP7_9ZZZZ
MSYFFKSIFRPIECYRKWYKMVSINDHKSCDCLVKCKYPPPSSLGRIPIFHYDMFNNQHLNKKNLNQ